MRKLLMATAAAVLLSSPVLAADLAPMPVEPAAPVYMPFTWTGFYVGVHAGYAWGDEDDDLDGRFEEREIIVEGPAASFDVNGFLGGAHAGYNVQFDSFVIGLEGDVDFSGADGDHEFSASDGLITGNLSLDSNWQASIRARAGFAFDRTLIYATGGVAFADADLEFNGSDGVGDFDFSDSQTFTGWTIGLGAEYAFTDNLIGRLEARYTDFGSPDFDLDGFDDTFDVDGRDVNVDWTQFSVLAGISYKF
jgi:outer membrane immunogenic protein